MVTKLPQRETPNSFFGSIWRHLGSIWRHLRDIWEASGRHLGDIWEASGGIWAKGGPEEDLKEIVPKHVFFYRKWRERPFRVRESHLTLTKSAACAQKLAGDRGDRASDTLMDILS